MSTSRVQTTEALIHSDLVIQLQGYYYVLQKVGKYILKQSNKEHIIVLTIH